MQLNLFRIYDTQWLIKQSTKSMTATEHKILKNTGKIGKMPLGTTTEAEIIRIFQLFYSKRHASYFGDYTQHPRNKAKYAIWELRYIRYFKKGKK